MEKIIPIKKTITENKHQFFCDGCGQFLGESCEYDDGYYKRFGNYGPSINVNSRIYSMDKLFCDECAEKVEQELLQVIKKLGYKREDEY